jgi:hypothetical protein
VTESATHRCKHITWLACTIAKQCTRSAENKLLISHASTAYLEERKEK